MKTDRVLAHVRWLQPPYVGRAVLLVDRGGVVGFVPATEAEGTFSEFIADDGRTALMKALGTVAPNEFPAPLRKQARRPVA